MIITNRDGLTADPKDCDYYYGWFRREDGVLVEFKNCRTHGHGEVVGEWQSVN